LHKLQPGARYELTGKVIHSVAGGTLRIHKNELVHYGVEDVVEVDGLIYFVRFLTHALKHPETIYKMVYTVTRLLIDPWRYGVPADGIMIGWKHIERIFKEEEDLLGIKFQIVEPTSTTTG